MSLLDKMLDKSIDQEIVSFVGSREFSRFSLIMEQIYLNKLIEFQNTNSLDPVELASNRKVLNFYCNLPELLKILADNTIADSKEQNNK